MILHPIADGIPSPTLQCITKECALKHGLPNSSNGVSAAPTHQTSPKASQLLFLFILLARTRGPTSTDRTAGHPAELVGRSLARFAAKRPPSSNVWPKGSAFRSLTTTRNERPPNTEKAIALSETRTGKPPRRWHRGEGRILKGRIAAGTAGERTNACTREKRQFITTASTHTHTRADPEGDAGLRAVRGRG